LIRMFVDWDRMSLRGPTRKRCACRIAAAFLSRPDTQRAWIMVGITCEKDGYRE
jgi:hypothetical protein